MFCILANKMLRTITATLTIVVLLTCPYLCMGDGVGMRLAERQTHLCDCPQSDNQSDSGRPSCPTDKGPDCLCHGALADSVRTTELGDWDLLDVNSSLDNVCLADLSVTSTSFELPHHFPPFSTGRDVCALTCALLL